MLGRLSAIYRKILGFWEGFYQSWNESLILDAFIWLWFVGMATPNVIRYAVYPTLDSLATHAPWLYNILWHLHAMKLTMYAIYLWQTRTWIILAALASLGVLTIRYWLYGAKMLKLSLLAHIALGLFQMLVLAVLVSIYDNIYGDIPSRVPTIACLFVIVMAIIHVRARPWMVRLFHKSSVHPMRWLLITVTLLGGAAMWLVIFYGLVASGATSLWVYRQKLEGTSIGSLSQHGGLYTVWYEVHIEAINTRPASVQAHVRVYLTGRYLEQLRDKTTHQPEHFNLPGSPPSNSDEGLLDPRHQITFRTNSQLVAGDDDLNKTFSLDTLKIDKTNPLDYYFDTPSFTIRTDYTVEPPSHFPSDSYYFNKDFSLKLPSNLEYNEEIANYRKVLLTFVADDPDIRAPSGSFLTTSMDGKSDGSYEIHKVYIVKRALRLELFTYSIALTPLLLIVVLASLAFFRDEEPSGNSKKSKRQAEDSTAFSIGLAVLVILPLRQVLVPTSISTSMTYIDLIFGLEIVSAAGLLVIIYSKEIAKHL